MPPTEPGKGDPTVRRVQATAAAILVLATVGVGLATWSLPQLLATLVSGVLMLLNFRGLTAVTNRLLDADAGGLGLAHGAFLLGRHALLGIVLCAMVLMPGVGPIPVALGLSALVIAILLEAILQLFAGAQRRS